MMTQWMPEYTNTPAAREANDAGYGMVPSVGSSYGNAPYVWQGRGYFAQQTDQQGAYVRAGVDTLYTSSYGEGQSDLADLGLAARDSTLDQRWRLFMEDTGLLRKM